MPTQAKMEWSTDAWIISSWGRRNAFSRSPYRMSRLIPGKTKETVSTVLGYSSLTARSPRHALSNGVVLELCLVLQQTGAYSSSLVDLPLQSVFVPYVALVLAVELDVLRGQKFLERPNSQTSHSAQYQRWVPVCGPDLYLSDGHSRRPSLRTIDTCCRWTPAALRCLLYRCSKCQATQRRPFRRASSPVRVILKYPFLPRPWSC